MADVQDELARMYTELLREEPPFLRFHDLLEFARKCVEADFAASEMIALHLSVVDAAAANPIDFSTGETILAMALSFRTLLQQVQAGHSDLVQLEQAHNRLLDLYGTKSTTLSMVAHDLSSYLVTSRILALSMVRDTRENMVKERARYMLKVLDDQEHLIGNLLNIGKLEAGLPVHTQQVDLKAVVARCFDAARRMSGHTFSVTGPNLQVMAEEDKVRQILENLVGNAVKFSPQGGQVEITISRQDDRAVVVVRDHGVGIAAEDMPHIFEPYYRAVDGQTGGTGLGLSIVKTLLERLQGDIHVDSDPSGTTIRFTLPLKG